MRSYRTRFTRPHRGILGLVAVFVIGIYYLSRSRSLNIGSFRTESTVPRAGVAIILEPRAAKYIIRAILNAFSIIPSSWKVQLFTDSPASDAWAMFSTTPSLQVHFEEGRLQLYDAGVANLPDYAAINKYLIQNTSFWRAAEGEKILYFQGDSCFCSFPTYSLCDFLHFDYIGAPWAGVDNDLDEVLGGNGGTSLRSRNAMVACSQAAVDGSYPINGRWEDVFFSDCVREYFRGTIPTREDSMRFSVESVYYPRPFATHKVFDSVLDGNQGEQLRENCPELKAAMPYRKGPAR